MRFNRDISPEVVPAIISPPKGDYSVDARFISFICARFEIMVYISISNYRCNTRQRIFICVYLYEIITKFNLMRSSVLSLSLSVSFSLLREIRYSRIVQIAHRLRENRELSINEMKRERNGEHRDA